MSWPSMRIEPSVTSYNRDNSEASTDLPDPVEPTSASVSPGSTVALTWRKAQLSDSDGATPSESGNLNPTSTSSSLPPAGGSATGPSVISRGASKISAIRLAAVNDSCVMDSRKPSDAIGHTSDSIIVMNATSVPIVT